VPGAPRAAQQQLRSELEELARGDARSRTDLTYLKNVLLKLVLTRDEEEEDALMLVVGTLLQFSPAEMRQCSGAAARRAQRRAKADAGAAGYVAGLLGGLWGGGAAAEAEDEPAAGDASARRASTAGA
jgi:hypothetical protein